MYLSIYGTQLVSLTRSNTYRNVASRLLAGLVTVEQARTTASFARKRDARYRAARDRDPTGQTDSSGEYGPPNVLVTGRTKANIYKTSC